MFIRLSVAWQMCKPKHPNLNAEIKPFCIRFRNFPDKSKQS